MPSFKGKSTTMKNKEMEDERFSQITWHPKFRRVPRNVRRVKIDKRFEQMFDDPKFKLKHAVDKRGRPLVKTSDEDLRRYYELESSSESEAEEDFLKTKRPEPGKKRKDPKSSNRQDVKQPEENQDVRNDDGKSESTSADENEEEDAKEDKAVEYDDDEEEEEEEISDEEEVIKLDLARGEGNISTSSSGESSSEWEFEEGEEGLVHEWEDIDANKAPVTETAASRLAICNMDWERITARDILILLNSFKPPSGIVRNVRIYPSEFGLQRMNEEKQRGPVELRQLKSEEDKSDEESSEDEDEEKEFLDKAHEESQRKVLLEKLRQYELNRLKYYYAIAECDSAETAEFIYTNCDGMEYETSGTRVDLRFVPEDMEFDQEPKDEAASVGDLSSYRPVPFVNKALQHSRPTLTWEEERDPKRAAIAKKAFDDPKEWDRLDLNCVLASPSGSEESDGEGMTDIVESQTSGGSCPKMASDQNGVEEEPLKQGNDEKDEEDSDMEMEIRWDSAVEEKLQNVEKSNENNDKKLTQWQRYLERRKAKKRQRKEEAKQKRFAVKRQRYGDSDEEETPSPNEWKKDKANAKLNKGPDSEEYEDSQREAELELLLVDSDDEDTKRRHFNLKKLLKENKTRGAEGHKKGVQRGTAKDKQEEFLLDVDDPRFGAVYTSHLFNIDPSDPAYKKTPGMEKLVKGKSHKSKNEPGSSVHVDVEAPRPLEEAMALAESTDTPSTPSVDVSALAKRIKAKTEMMRKEKERKRVRKF